MDPKVWGPGLWTYIHSVAAMATTAAKRSDFKELTYHLAKTLPCDACKKHFRQNMRDPRLNIDNYMSSERSLFMWTYLIHDAVNIAKEKYWASKNPEAAARGESGVDRPSFQDIYPIYFEVPGDSDAVSHLPYEEAVCEEICNGDKVSSSYIDQTKSLKINSSFNRKFKPGK